jgi:hypothetical protein
MDLSPAFIEGLDYHMKDDFGAEAEKISALAGVHYFACRPYYTKPVELFSPPRGMPILLTKYPPKFPKKIFTDQWW